MKPRLKGTLEQKKTLKKPILNKPQQTQAEEKPRRLKTGVTKNLASKAPQIAESSESALLNSLDKFAEQNGIVQFDNSTVEQEYLRLPAILADVSSRELGCYLHTFTQQKMWVRTLKGRIDALIREAENDLDIIRAKVYAGLPTRMAVAEKELNLLEDSRARELLEAIKQHRTKADMLKNYLESLDDGLFNISREVSRRMGDFNQEGRAHTISRR